MQICVFGIVYQMRQLRSLEVVHLKSYGSKARFYQYFWTRGSSTFGFGPSQVPVGDPYSLPSVISLSSGSFVISSVVERITHIDDT